MTQHPTGSRKRVSHITIHARQPLASYSDAAYQLLAQWLDVDTDLLREVLEAIRHNKAYETYQIPKPGRQEWREINDPYGGLKEIQRRILDRLLYPIPVSNAAHGAVPSRSVVTNALQHLPDAQHLLCLDIRKAFPSVRFRRVHGIFRRYVRPLMRTHGPLPAARAGGHDPVDEVIHLLAALTTAQQEVTLKGQTKRVYCLPQGAPTSGYLLNLACLELDRKIFKIFDQNRGLKLRYTRYLDDLTISSPVEIPNDVAEELTLAIIKNDFNVQHSKTQILGPQQPHVICGVMLSNNQLSAEPELIQRCTQLLQKAEKQANPRTERQRRRKIRGIISFFKQVYGDQLPAGLQESYQRYRDVRNLPQERPVEAPQHPVVPQRALEDQNPQSVLAQWLDIDPLMVEQAKNLLEANNGYETWSIDKKNGKKRIISSPRDVLKDVQERILTRLLYHIPVSVAAHGFVPGRSIVTNALAHLDAKHLLNLDLKDAFPSVTKHRVALALQMGLGALIKKFGLRCDKALRDGLVELMAALTTHNNELPQGAPTSGYLLNLSCRAMDKRVFELIQELAPEVTYTRYADDLTFTSTKPLPERFLPRIKRTIQRSGYKWNPKKTHQAAVEKGQNLEICGIYVTEGQLRIPPKKMKYYRSVLRRAAHKVDANQLDNELRSQVQGIVGFVQMIYGELPRNLAKPYEDYLRQHPSARPTGASREKFSLYPRVIL